MLFFMRKECGLMLGKGLYSPQLFQAHLQYHGPPQHPIHQKDSSRSIKEWFHKVEELSQPLQYGVGNQGSTSTVMPTSTVHRVISETDVGSGININSLNTSAVGGVAGNELPESVVVHLWALYDELFSSSTGSPQYSIQTNLQLLLDPVDLERRQYEFFSLLAEINDIDVAKVERLSERLTHLKEVMKIETQQKKNNVVEEDNKESHSTSVNPSRKHNKGDGLRLIKILDDLRNAVTPMYSRWLSQSASLDHIPHVPSGTEVISSVGSSKYLSHFNYSPNSLRLYDRGPPGIIKIMHMREELLEAKRRLLKRKENETLSDLFSNSGPECTTTDDNNNNNTARSQYYTDKCNEYLKAIKTLNDTAFDHLIQWMRKRDGIVLRELRWDGPDTNPAMLDRIIAGEVVHPFGAPSMDSMKMRLQPCAREPRYLYCFFHEHAPLDPLIAVQVALTRGVADSVDVVLGRHEVPVKGEPVSSIQKLKPYDAAIFYSINSIQGGLEGGDLGNLLIKAVVGHLQQHGHKQVQRYLMKEASEELHARAKKEPNNISELSNITSIVPHQPPLVHYSTLSPIPNYVKWMLHELKKVMDKLLSNDGCAINHNNTESDSDDITTKECIIADAIISSGSRLFGPLCSDDEHDNNNSKDCDIRMTNNVITIDKHPKGTFTSPPAISRKTLIIYARHIIDFVDAYTAIAQLKNPSFKYDNQFIKCCPKSHPTIISETAEAVEVLKKFKEIMLFGGLRGASVNWFSSTDTSVISENTTHDNCSDVKSEGNNKETINCENMPHNHIYSMSPSNTSFEYGSFHDILRRPLLRSVGCYLFLEKRRGKILDPVGNFHMSNGAQIYRLNWLANRTLKGSKESCCVMVNYYYLNNNDYIGIDNKADNDKGTDDDAHQHHIDDNDITSPSYVSQSSPRNIISMNAYLYQSRNVISLGSPLQDMLANP